MTIEQLNELSIKAHEDAVKKGFYSPAPSKLKSILLILSEISEALESDRNNKHCNLFDLRYHLRTETDQEFKSFFKNEIKDTFQDELADVAIRLLDYAGFVGYEFEKYSIDLGSCSNYEKFEFLFELHEAVVGMLYNINKINVVMFLLIDYCKDKDIDLEKHIELKMKYNELREYKNGKAY